MQQDTLALNGVSAKVIDLRSARPWDAESVLSSVARTGRLVVTDTGWTTGGFSAEVVARVAESGIELASPPRRVPLPSHPTPTSPALAARTTTRARPRSPPPPPKPRPSASRRPEIATAPDQPLDVPDPSFAGPF